MVTCKGDRRVTQVPHDTCMYVFVSCRMAERMECKASYLTFPIYTLPRGLTPFPFPLFLLLVYGRMFHLPHFFNGSSSMSHFRKANPSSEDSSPTTEKS
ncbi:hypothetical protein FKM82_001393 [Ascaphus truei]